MSTDSRNGGQPVFKHILMFLSSLALVTTMAVTAQGRPSLLAQANAKKSPSGVAVDKKSAGSSKTASGKASANASGKPTVYEFGASYCVPCRAFAPTFEAEFCKIDIEDDKSKSLVDKFKVVSVPKFVIVDAAGKLKFEHDGAIDQKKLTAEVDKVVGK
jgi:thiol-disulfide isomerase/thioredoxin